ncbi:MAG: hypothetical protein IID05_08520 [Gemmatimonadetes bacterium]|nr:hypothetical protein [Gemmatimonadota bacterium]
MMAQINTGRVILGGLAAGLVINISESVLNLAVVADETEEIVASLGVEPASGAVIGMLVVVGFLIGIATVWLYAAIRPRFGAGPRAAMIAGAVVWALAHLWRMTDITLFLGLPMSFMMLVLVWTLVESLLAAYVGAWLYQEQSIDE